MWTRGALTAVFLLATAPLGATPSIQHWVTDNGARVYFVSAPEIPIVDVELVFDAGAARDDRLPGLAQMVNALSSEGAGGMTADDIASEFDRLGAKFGSSSQRDMSSFTLRSLSDSASLLPAARLLARIVGRPDFPPEAVERIRRQMLVSLDHLEQSPGEIAERAFYAGLYPDHPYKALPEGSRESVLAVERSDLTAFHRRYFVASNLVVALVGDLTRQEAERLSVVMTEHLPRGAPAPPVPPVKEFRGADPRILEHPSTQTHLLLGAPGMTRDDDDYFSLYVGNHVLGGSGLVSLLSKEVRESRGLSYSVSSYFIPMRARGPFRIGLQTRNSQVAEAVGVVMQTLRRFVESGPTEAELKAAKRNLIGGFPLRIDSNRSVRNYLAVIGFYDLPLDYLDRYRDRIAAVTSGQVRDAFRRRIDPERIYLVLVGAVPEETRRALLAGVAPPDG